METEGGNRRWKLGHAWTFLASMESQYVQLKFWKPLLLCDRFCMQYGICVTPRSRGGGERRRAGGKGVSKFRLLTPISHLRLAVCL